MAKDKPFATEADLCAAFIAAAGEDWTSFAETAGWDILLVRKADGFQIGIQAKLRLNAEVFAQAIEGYYGADRAGPDCRAVLVPWGEAKGLSVFGPYVGITVIRLSLYGSPGRDGATFRLEPHLPRLLDRWIPADWYEMAPAKRHKLPEYVPDVAAGVRSPIQLTEWKIGALKLQAMLEKQGFLVRTDFKAVGVDHRRWIAPVPGWLAVKDGRYVKGEHFPNFAAQHPVVYEKVKADMAASESKFEAARTGTLL